MILTQSQYETTSKEELIQELTDINSSFVNDISTIEQFTRKIK